MLFFLFWASVPSGDALGISEATAVTGAQFFRETRRIAGAIAVAGAQLLPGPGEKRPHLAMHMRRMPKLVQEPGEIVDANPHNTAAAWAVAGAQLRREPVKVAGAVAVANAKSVGHRVGVTVSGIAFTIGQ